MRDFVRTALFNILQKAVPNSVFLDLFCGTGSVGLEALSRDAKQTVFVDHSSGACQVTRRNLQHLQLLERAYVLHNDFREAMARLQRRGFTFDLVFVGPPYEKGLADLALRRLGDSKLLRKEAIVVTEIHKKSTLEKTYDRLKQVDKRIYGDSVLLFYRQTVG